MGKIHHTPQEPIKLRIQDLSVPIMETHKIKRMFKDVFDAEVATGVSRLDIMAACASGKTIGGYGFAFPSLKDVEDAFPNYDVVHHPMASSAARPTTVHTRTPGPYGKTADLDYRTMTGTRDVWDLTKKAFESIVSKTNGWQLLLPPGVTGMTVHAPNWQPPRGRAFTAMGTAKAKPTTPAFECRQLKSSISITFKSPKSVKTIRDVPGFVLSNCIWKP